MFMYKDLTPNMLASEENDTTLWVTNIPESSSNFHLIQRM